MLNKLLFFLFVPALLFADLQWEGHAPEGFNVEVSISSKEISLLDTLEVKITLSYPINYTIDIASLKSHLLSGFDPIASSFALVEERISSLPSNDKTINQSIRYQLEPLIPGSFVLSFLEILFSPKTPGMPPVHLFSDVFNIQVKPMEVTSIIPPSPATILPMSPLPPIEMDKVNRQKLIESPELANAEAARNVEILREKTFPLVPLLVFLFFFIGVAVVRKPLMNYWSERHKKPVLTPKAKALQQLQQIQKEEMISQEQYEQLYIALTNTVRNYIEEQFQIKAPNLTTQEFLKKAMESPQFDDMTKKLLSDFLQRADMVKFAEFHPTHKDYENAERAAQNFLQQA